MSFTPKIIHDEEVLPIEPAFSDEPGEELDLPDDFLSLGKQLAGEAALLAARYPAGQASRSEALVQLPQLDAPPSAGGGGRAGAGRFLGPALIVLVAVAAVVSVWHGQGASLTTETVQRDLAASAKEARPRSGQSQTVEHQAVERSDDPIFSTLDGATSPATVVHELTGPELEGFLDLLETEVAAESRLSI
jgi:hypothetical protein